MSWLFDHLIVAPVLLPLTAGAVMLAIGGERRRNVNAVLNLISTCSLVAISVILLRGADAAPSGVLGVYRIGDWPAPFAIVLVLDRLSALMLLLTSIVASAALLFSLARWHRAGVLFHPLFQFLQMGLNGAFLTGDLFNLFVFFEVLLAASYGLALHGSGTMRVRAGLHYISINLVASLLFLVGVSLIYAVCGTLNMAHLGERISAVGASDRALLEAGAAILAIAFLVKAGTWPLCFWLPATYSAAASPVAAAFMILTKVGAYIILRLWLLLFGSEAGASAEFGSDWLLFGGIATIAFGAISSLASQDLPRLAANSVLISAGTVLSAIGMAQAGVTGAALYYLVSSTMSLAVLFLLVELVERGREPGADVIAVTREAYGEADEIEDEAEAGVAIPATMGMLALAFVACTLIVAGLPPLSGFIAKFALLGAAITGRTTQHGSMIAPAAWVLLVVLILSGLMSLVALSRAGIQAFWASPDRDVPRVRIIEMAPVAALLFLCVAQTIYAGPVMRFMEATARSLHMPEAYVRAVLHAPVGRDRSPAGGT